MTDDERQTLASIEIHLADLVQWKQTVNELLYGSLKGEFGYFHRTNFIWRLLVLWPVMILSISFGAILTYVIQHYLK